MKFQLGSLLLVFNAVAFSAEPTALEVITKALTADDANFQKIRSYLFTEDRVERELDKQHNLKKTEKTSLDVFYIDGTRLTRLVAKDGKPLSEKEKEKEDKKLQKIQERARKSPKEREKDLQVERRKRSEGLALLPEVFDLKHLGEEFIEGHATYKIDATPKPGYKPKKKEAHMLHKLKGILWIDKAEFQIVKADISVVEPVSFGWFLVKLEKGARIQLLQTRVNDEVWLPKLFNVAADVRLLGIFRGIEHTATMSNYRKFKTDAEIISVTEIDGQ